MAIREKDLQVTPDSSIDHLSLEDQVYLLIKKAILGKELRPGEKVSHAEWAEKLNISRTPVRDALKRLEHEGLIIRETERIWHVYTMTLEDLYKIYDARLATDGQIAYLAARAITDEMTQQMKDLLAQMAQTSKNNDYDAFLSVNNRFHDLLDSACQNPYLVRLSQFLREKTTRLYPKGINIDHRLEKGLEENVKIAKAIMQRNPELAEKHQRDHIASYRDHLIRVIKEMVIPYTGPEF